MRLTVGSVDADAKQVFERWILNPAKLERAPAWAEGFVAEAFLAGYRSGRAVQFVQAVDGRLETRGQTPPAPTRRRPVRKRRPPP